MPRLLEHRRSRRPSPGRARTHSRGWDFRQTAGSGAAAYFSVVWRNLLELTFHDELPRAQWPDGGERWFNVVRTIIDEPNSHWWDNRRDADDRRAPRRRPRATRMIRARDELTRIRSRDTSGWAWGDLHRLTLVNPTLGDSGRRRWSTVCSTADRSRSAAAAGSSNANAWDAAEGYDVTAVPSMRMVVDLADLDRSRWIQLSGSSGHAYHEHYADQLPLWAAGRTLPWAFGDEAVDQVHRGHADAAAHHQRMTSVSLSGRTPSVKDDTRVTDVFCVISVPHGANRHYVVSHACLPPRDPWARRVRAAHGGERARGSRPTTRPWASCRCGSSSRACSSTTSTPGPPRRPSGSTARRSSSPRPRPSSSASGPTVERAEAQLADQREAVAALTVEQLQSGTGTVAPHHAARERRTAAAARARRRLHEHERGDERHGSTRSPRDRSSATPPCAAPTPLRGSLENAVKDRAAAAAGIDRRHRRRRGRRCRRPVASATP